MNPSILKTDPPETAGPDTTDIAVPDGKPGWETPQMEDVSEQVMAQPYIRFT
jgi:hypothetical protein